MFDLLIKNASLQDGSSGIDIAVADGKIVKKGQKLNVSAVQELDIGGRLLIPGFVEGHVHLDIALMNSWKTPGRTVPYSSQKAMLTDMENRKAAFTREDIEQRAGAALEMASRHGITTLRAQCHVDADIKLKHLEILLGLKEKYAGRIHLQIVAFPNKELIDVPGVVDLFHEAMKMGADAMGSASVHDRDRKGHLDAAFKIAVEHDADLDVHADLALLDQVDPESLDIVHLAKKTVEYGYQGRVCAGHLSALDSADPDTADKIIEMIKEADIQVISLPDLYRLGRADTKDVRRGLTRVKQMLGAGINVAFASNNIRDPLRPLGNLDPLEEALILAYGAHMDSVEELNTLLQMATGNAARALRLPSYGLEPGCIADMVVLDAFSPSAAIVEQAEKNYVFKGGRLIAVNKRESQLFYGNNLDLIKSS